MEKSIFIDLKKENIQVLIEGRRGNRFLSKIEKCKSKINQVFDKNGRLDISLCAYRAHDDKGNVFPIDKKIVERILGVK